MDDKTQEQLKELFGQLPKPIQRAITSVDIQKKLREAADSRKLHLDQWQTMENEVLMTLFGLKPIEDLEKNIRTNIGVSAELAAELAGDVSEIVFAPIRQELERELEHPEAKAKEVSGVEAARTQVLGQVSGVSFQVSENTDASALSPDSRQLKAISYPVPATPPPTPPTEKAIRAPASGAYIPGETSGARKDIHDDPYREPPA